MRICPNCGGDIQETHTLDSDDKVVSITYNCRRKYWNVKKKGCGYSLTAAQRKED